MKSTMKTLLAALLSVTALGAGTNALADGRGDRDRDGWRDGGRYEQRWDNRRHDGWRHHDHYRHVYRDRVYFYSPPPVVYPSHVIYGPTIYRNPPGPSVIIDLPPIIIR